MYTQSCPTLCDPMDCSLPGSSLHGILQAIVLECVAISFSRGSSWPRDRTCISSISCIDMLFVYHWATWEGLFEDVVAIYYLFETFQCNSKHFGHTYTNRPLCTLTKLYWARLFHELPEKWEPTSLSGVWNLRSHLGRNTILIIKVEDDLSRRNSKE